MSTKLISEVIKALPESILELAVSDGVYDLCVFEGDETIKKLKD